MTGVINKDIWKHRYRITNGWSFRLRISKNTK